MLPTEDDIFVTDAGYYDDHYRPSIAAFVLLAVQGYDDWELEVIIASQAIYAENFLSPN